MIVQPARYNSQISCKLHSTILKTKEVQIHNVIVAALCVQNLFTTEILLVIGWLKQGLNNNNINSVWSSPLN